MTSPGTPSPGTTGTGTTSIAVPGTTATPWRLAASVPVLVALLVVGMVLPTGAVLILETALILALFSVSTNLVVGYSGFVTFGQSLFYGVGGYTVALGWYQYRLPFWLLFLAAPLFAAIVAVPVGLLALRTRRWFFALITLAFTQLAYTIIEQTYSFTQGDTGVFGAMVPADLASPHGGYLFIFLVSAACVGLLFLVSVSPLGLVLRASRDNRRRVVSLGANVYLHQLVGFVIAAAAAGVAGALLMVNQQAAYPDLFNWFDAGIPLIAIIVGGLNSFIGPIIGAFIYEYADQYVTQHSTHWELVVGVILLVVVLAEPDGLVGVTRHLGRRHRRASAGVGGGGGGGGGDQEPILAQAASEPVARPITPPAPSALANEPGSDSWPMS